MLVVLFRLGSMSPRSQRHFRYLNPRSPEARDRGHPLWVRALRVLWITRRRIFSPCFQRVAGKQGGSPSTQVHKAPPSAGSVWLLLVGLLISRLATLPVVASWRVGAGFRGEAFDSGYKATQSLEIICKFAEIILRFE